MAQSLQASITITARETLTDGSRTLQDKTPLSATFNFLDATGALGAPKVFSDNRTLNSASENIDLSGALASGLGTPMVFTKVRLLAVRWNGASGTLTVSGAGGASAVMGANVVGAGGMIILIDPTLAGRGVTPTSADTLAITTTASGTYDILVAGE